MNELKSYTEYAVSTPTADFVIGFDFNYGEDAVNVTVDNVPATTAGYTVVYLNETTIRLSPSVPSGVVRLQRETDIDQTDHAYRAGAKFIAQTMDENFEQLRHSQQEVRDGFDFLEYNTLGVVAAAKDATELANTAAQDADDAAEAAVQIANNAAAQIDDKIAELQPAIDSKLQEFDNAINTIVVNDGVPALAVSDASGETQQQVNYNGGSKWHSRVGGYKLNERVILTSGDIVKSTINGNANNPNVNMTGWDFDDNTVDSIADLISIQNPRDGQVVSVSDDLRGGTFEYKASRASENNGGTVFNGWVRKYFGSVYLEWFCETDPRTTDCSTYLERALAVTKGVKAGANEFLFSGRVGIPDTDQSNYAERMIKIKGDGDTVFKIDCLAHGRATFTSASAKANPTTTANAFVGKVDVSGINFIGVNTTKGWALNEVNKNTTDIVFDGDRLYNTYIHENNFYHLKNAVKCVQNRGLSVEGGNAYSQSLSLLRNHFYHMTKIVESDSLINFRFSENECERNYGGIYCKTKDIAVPTSGVIRINDNLFEGGGQFLDLDGDVIAGSIFGNYLEFNTVEDVLVNQCQIRINGDSDGVVIGVNSFGGQIDFVGYDTIYEDIKIIGSKYNDLARTDYATSKPVLLGNHSTSRKLTTASSSISIGNSAPYWLKNGWVKEPTVSHFNSMNAFSAQESNVTFSRGIFTQPLNYSAVAPSGYTVKTLNANSELIVAILDLSALEGGASKNRLSTITGELDCNIDLVRDSMTIGNVSAKIHVSIFNTGFGSEPSAQYNQVRVHAKLLSIIQPFDIPIIHTQPSNLMKKQFVEPDVRAITESLGGGRYAIRLTNYLGSGVGTFGAPSDVYANLTWQASTACRQVPEQIGNNVSFIGYWW